MRKRGKTIATKDDKVHVSKPDSSSVNSEPIQSLIRIRPFTNEELEQARKQRVSQLHCASHVVDNKHLHLASSMSGNPTHDIVAGGLDKLDVDGVIWALDAAQHPLPAGLSSACKSNAELAHDYLDIDGMVSSLFKGYDQAIYVIGAKNTGKSKTLWGNAAEMLEVAEAGKDLRADLEQSGIEIVGDDGSPRGNYTASRRGIVFIICEAILAEAAKLVETTKGSKWEAEVEVELYATMGDKIKDLLQTTPSPSSGSSGFISPHLRSHPIKGAYLEEPTRLKAPSVDQSTFKKELELPLLHALATVQRKTSSSGAASAASGDSTTQYVMAIRLTQTNVSKTETGSQVSAVRSSKITFVEGANALAGGPGGRRGGAAAAADVQGYTACSAFRKVIDVLSNATAASTSAASSESMLMSSDQLQQRKVTSSSTGASIVVPYRDSLFTSLLSSTLGGSCHTLLLVNVSPHFAHADETNSILKLASKARMVQNYPHPSGGVASNLIIDMQTEIERLQHMVDASGGDGSSHSDSARSASSREKLLSEIRDREAALQELQDTTNRAIERYRLVELELERSMRKTQVLEKELDQTEAKKQQSQTEVTMERQKAFAQAFKNAFLVQKQEMEAKELESDLQRQVNSLKERLEKQQIQHAVVKSERDRLQFDNIKHEKEHVKTKQELGSQAQQIAKLTRELNAALDESEALTTKLNLAKFEATNETHELRSKLLEAERSRDSIEFTLESKTKEIDLLKASFERRLSDGTKADREMIDSLKAQLQAETEKNDKLHAEINKCKRSIDQHESKNRQLENELKASEASTYRQRMHDEHALQGEKSKRQKIMQNHAIERDGYQELLKDGVSVVDEMKKAESLIIARPSMYKSGSIGVQHWLQAHGLQALQSSFEINGFTDLISVSNINDQDLQTMKVLTGTRRKVLAAAGDLKQRLSNLSEGVSVLKEQEGGSQSRSNSTQHSPAGFPRAGSSRQASPSGTQPGRSASSQGATSGYVDPHAVPMKQLLDDLFEWIQDFQSAIEAESETSRAENEGNSSPRASSGASPSGGTSKN